MKSVNRISFWKMKWSVFLTLWRTEATYDRNPLLHFVISFTV